MFLRVIKPESEVEIDIGQVTAEIVFHFLFWDSDDSKDCLLHFQMIADTQQKYNINLVWD